jgi:hypothetical protein
VCSVRAALRSDSCSRFAAKLQVGTYSETTKDEISVAGDESAEMDAVLFPIAVVAAAVEEDTVQGQWVDHTSPHEVDRRE